MAVRISALLTLCSLVAGAPTAPAIDGFLQIDPQGGFNMSWHIAAGMIEMTIQWASGGDDYAAIGLHESPNNAKMTNAEVFLCNVDIKPACQVRTSRGYYEPAKDHVQYINTTSSGRVNNIAHATFTRALVVDNSTAKTPLTVAITDRLVGLIFARGTWFLHPMKHANADRGTWTVNLMTPGVAPPVPKPTPPAPKPTPVAGVWPNRLDAKLRMAPSQLPLEHLEVKLGPRLRYDFPGRQQLWQYWDVEDLTEQIEFQELWVGPNLYEISFEYPNMTAECSSKPMKDGCTCQHKWDCASNTCGGNPPTCGSVIPGPEVYCSSLAIGLYVLRPDWLVHTKYAGQQYLTRQPEPNQANVSGFCYTTNNQLCQLFTDPAPVGGITNNWLALNSTIGEPIKLTGPDNFQKPMWQTVQEYYSFGAVDSFDADVFKVPKECPPPKPPPLEMLNVAVGHPPTLGQLRPHSADGPVQRAKGRLW